MTKLMEEIIEQFRAVPESRQDDVARSVQQQLAEDDRWFRSTESNRANVSRLVKDVVAAHGRGETELLDPEKL